MPHVNSIIPSMVQGMSQQAPELRLPTHADYQFNMVSHQTYGLGRRLGTDHVRTLSNINHPARMWTSWVSRDSTEKYHLMYDGARLRVVGFEGTEYPVIAEPETMQYLNTSTPSKDLLSVSLADTWMILNRRITTRASSTTSTTIANSTAVVWVKQGSYGAEYKLTLGANSVKFLCAPADVSTLQTSYIAQQLVAMLNAHATITGTYTITHTTGASWFTIARTVEDGAAFDLEAYDSLAGAGLGMVQHSAEAFDRLPPTAPDDYICKILGNPGESEDDYWVQYTTDRTDSGEARGLWTECRAPGSTYALDATTLPHVLERKVDNLSGSVTGTPGQVYFEFTEATWPERVAGDDDTVPIPGFIGSSLASAAVFQNRLWLAYKGSVFATRSADLFNTWRSSASQVIDSDPIDVDLTPGRLSEDTVLNLKHLVSFAESLFLIGNKAQLVVGGDQAVTPANFSAPLASSYEVDDVCRPVVNEDKMFLANETGGYTAMREYTVNGSSRLKNGQIISAAIPQLMTGTPVYMSSSPSEQVLFVRTAGAPSYLFVYKWFDTPNGSRVIASWGVWGFGNRIISHEVVGSTLMLLMQRDDGVTIETLEIPANTKTVDSDWPVHLDRKVAFGTASVNTRFVRITGGGGGGGGGTGGGGDPTDPDEGGGGPDEPVPGDPPSGVPDSPVDEPGGGGGIGIDVIFPDVSSSNSSAMSGALVGFASTEDGRDKATASYDSATNITTVAYPWTPTASSVVIDLSTNRVIKTGTEITSLTGDWTSKPMLAGFTYESRYRFGQALVTKQDATGGLAAVRAARVQVTMWNVNYSFAGPFNLKTIREHREDAVKVVHPWKVGWPVGSQPIDGRASCSVLNKAEASRVEITSETWWPLWFVSADWDGSVTMESSSL
jgi:hypothetical protein